MNEKLEKKVKQAVRLLQSFAKNRRVEICYSGGKDSDVILELAKMAQIDFVAIYKCTTIDPPYTITHCMQKGVIIMRPKTSFFELVRKKGMPTRWVRFCCSYLKEYPVLPYAVQGIRRSESVKRQQRYKETEPNICRIYDGYATKHVNVLLPILTWSDKDIAEFVRSRGITLHPLYYDSNGDIHVERRLGCIGCPLKCDQGKADFIKFPRFFRLLVSNVGIWWELHQETKSHKTFSSHYALVAYNIFYSSLQQFYEADKGLFGSMDWKKALEDYFHIDLH